MALHNFDSPALHLQSLDITSSESIDQLKEWMLQLRQKWNLANRVIKARNEHHNSFYQGGDMGHQFFIGNLREEQIVLEETIQKIESQAYKVLLNASNAGWLLSEPDQPMVCEEIIEEPVQSPKSTPLFAKSPKPRKKNPSVSSSSSTDFDWDSLSKRSSDSEDTINSDHEPEIPRSLALLEQMRGYFVPPPGYAGNDQWHQVISGLFQHVIARTPSLMMLLSSSNFEGVVSVVELLDALEKKVEDQDECCEKHIEQIWKKMKLASNKPGSEGILTIKVIGQVILNLKRKQDETSVVVAGGFVWKNARPRDLLSEEWDLFYQFASCAGCASAFALDYETYSKIQAMSKVGIYPAWQTPNDTDYESVYKLLGISLCGTNAYDGCRKTIQRIKTRKQKNNTVSVEEWERAWGYFLFGKENVGLERLLKDPRVQVIARNRQTKRLFLSFDNKTNQPIKGAEDLWVCRVRSGFTTMERKLSKWRSTTYYPLDESVLDKFRHIHSFERRYGLDYNDCCDVIVLDNRPYDTVDGANWGSFGHLVSDILSPDVSYPELLEREKGRYETKDQGSKLKGHLMFSQA